MVTYLPQSGCILIKRWGPAVVKKGQCMYRTMHSAISRWLFVLLALALPTMVWAQTTATNAVALIEDNVTNARDTLVPLAIGAAVLFIAIAAGKRFWTRIFG